MVIGFKIFYDKIVIRSIKLHYNFHIVGIRVSIFKTSCNVLVEQSLQKYVQNNVATRFLVLNIAFCL